MNFATPNPSPSKRAAAQGSNVTPVTKKQRMFSPTSPKTPDKFSTEFRPSNIFARLPPAGDSFNTSIDSMNCSLSNTGSPVLSDCNDSQIRVVGSGDVIICSPPRIERLQLFDYPRTPASIARSSGVHVSASNQRKDQIIRQSRGVNPWNRY